MKNLKKRAKIINLVSQLTKKISFKKDKEHKRRDKQDGQLEVTQVM
jgi:hypothetical protein